MLARKRWSHRVVIEADVLRPPKQLHGNGRVEHGVDGDQEGFRPSVSCTKRGTGPVHRANKSCKLSVSPDT